MPIQTIFCNPPICVARVGSSSAPMESFSWVPSTDPHNIGETRIEPAWTLDVQPDGSVMPRLPDKITLRDDGNLRPVAPFVEVWCEVGEDGDPDSWQRQPLTTRLLAEEGLNTSNLDFEITAMNFKVARRTGNPNHRFGTFPSLTIRGDEHVSQPVLGVSPSPTSGGARMIPSGRSIPLGRVRVIRPGTQPAPGATAWADEVNVETIRLRFTPPKGEFFGPDNNGQIPTRRRGTEVFGGYPPENAFLDPAAGWFGERTLGGLVVPGDTYDGAETASGASEGVIDDTCELRIAVRLNKGSMGGTVLQALASIWCGPPDYAPDRRPFLSLADSFNDRAGDSAARNEEVSDEDLDRWVEDLLERAFETVSLLNVDFWRAARGATLSGDELRDPIPGETYPQPERALGSRDALRDRNIAVEAPSDNVPLPMTERARERHRNLSDIVALKKFVRENPNRLQQLIRPPFRVAANESGNATTMQMPPFMRGSNAQPLTLAAWQYDLLMEWQRRVKEGDNTIEDVADQPALSDEAEKRRAAVLQQISDFGEF